MKLAPGPIYYVRINMLVIKKPRDFEFALSQYIISESYIKQHSVALKWPDHIGTMDMCSRHC